MQEIQQFLGIAAGLAAGVAANNHPEIEAMRWHLRAAARELERLQAVAR